MNKLSKKQSIMISLMLFSLFFGAGNLIFPPMMGKLSGTNLVKVMFFFGLTAVVLPILGVIAVSQTHGLQNLAKRIHPVFATFFTVLIYLSIGPLLGIPRAGSLPFEMAVAPYLPAAIPNKVALFVYTLLFFGTVSWLAFNPGKLVERMGKVLTPTLLFLILILYISSYIKGMPSHQAPLASYETTPMIQGFLGGYNTMDAVAALNFGFVIYLTIQQFGIQDEKEILSITRKCGLLAGTLLMTVYMILADLGAKSTLLLPHTKNGAEILSQTSQYLLGDAGAILMALIFTLACLTTSVGLVTSCSAYFTELFHHRLSYRTWVLLWSSLSLVLANFGLNRILTYSASILTMIYPVSIVLVLMAIINPIIQSNRLVYSATVYVTMAISMVDGIENLGVKVPLFSSIFGKYLPFAHYRLGWVLPSLIVFILTFIVAKLTTLGQVKHVSLSSIPEE